MEENNLIAICFPMGSGGHIAGRLLASCDNVAWYDHEKNGKYPWYEYRIGDDYNFSKLHFNKRFSGAVGRGVCDLTVPPVLDMAEKQGMSYNKESITDWKNKVYPNNLLYTLHADLDKIKQFFNPAKYFIIIPNDVELLLNRWLDSTANYYVSPKNKSFTYRDLYRKKAKEKNSDLRSVLREDMIKLINNYKTHSTADDVVITEVKDLYDPTNFESICKKLDLTFNQQNHQKTVSLALRRSHL